ncbi:MULTISPECIES: DUF4192 domain-containing protein [unclassified Nocardioides]|uniref:DUF4192 domain-containing protein n=1 Tax=unclassified Nocardioides TaxID=2615069 RepID=UPI00138EEB3D|nr:MULTISPECIES: DUF4192 domain-containing protein [unclassified Nocardioides]
MTTSPSRPTTLTVRNPEDMLAIAPVLLGFWPEDSIVMMTFGADRPFHARIDLPPLEVQTLAVQRELDELLLGPARRHYAQHVVLLYFTTDRAAALAAHRALRRGCRRAGITVVAALAADGERHADLEGPGRHAPGTPYDVSAHPFVVEALVSGRLTHRSRAELVASLDSDPQAVAGVEEALASSGLADEDAPTDGRSIRREGRWVERRVAELVAAGAEPSDDEAARLLWVLQASRVRDAAWSLISRRDADRHVRFWSALVRRTPDALVPAPATLLGWAAWQAGDGAKAWVALDRCEQVEPDYALAVYLGSLLQQAVPPEFWEGGFDWALGLGSVHG